MTKNDVHCLDILFTHFRHFRDQAINGVVGGSLSQSHKETNKICDVNVNNPYLDQQHVYVACCSLILVYFFNSLTL